MKILIAPLDWGLGHATRCIPLISTAIEAGHEVIIACEQRPRTLLEIEFPQLKYVNLQGINIVYPQKLPMTLAMLVQFPKILKGIWNERKAVQNIVKEYQIDVLLSDNRFGVYSKEAYNMYMSHQLTIAVPKPFHFLEPVGFFLHSLIYKKYQKLLVPDFHKDHPLHLAGKLSHCNHSYVQYLGYLSRFKAIAKNEKSKDSEYDLFISLSGPEPSRTNLEDLLIKILDKTKLTAILLRGIPEDNNQDTKFTNPNIEVHSHLNTKSYLDKIQSAKLVIARSGYSSIMDFLSLSKSALLIPTPGQTEQEYLGKVLQEKHLFYSVSQDSLSIDIIEHALLNPLPAKDFQGTIDLLDFWKEVECKI